MTPKEREDLIAEAAAARERAGLAPVVIRTDDSDAFVIALSRSTLEGVASLEAARRGTRVLSNEHRDEMIQQAVKARLDSGAGADGARDLERELRDSSDAFLQARVPGEIDLARKRIAWERQRRQDDVRRDIERVTPADMSQAESDLAAYRMDARYASPHASPHDAQAHQRAIEMRARSLARQRTAREDADARLLAGLDKPRMPAPSTEPDPFAPTLPADPAWTRTKKGRS